MKALLKVFLIILLLLLQAKGWSISFTENLKSNKLTPISYANTTLDFYFNTLHLSAPIPELEERIYIIIGVFAIKNNAIRCVNEAKKKGYSAIFSLNPTNKLYYVSLYSSTKIEEAKEKLSNIITDPLLFPGIWLFAYKNPDVVIEPSPEPTPSPMTVQNDTPSVVNTVEQKVDKTDVKATNEQVFLKEDEYLIFSKVVYGRNNKEIQGKVEVVDPVRAKLMKSINANQLDVVKDPKNGNNLIRLTADIFGYRKVQHDLILTEISAQNNSEFISLKGDTILVEFSLDRLKTGDIAIMYNVFFRNDAAVMESTSKYELNSLVEMLKENPNYQIVIHGHTNGNQGGKIIKLQQENPDFFVITEENKRGYGSAKTLSTERAITIKRYLLENGIAEERMTVKGWGGKKMIYDTNSLDAKKNVRVEIEILQD